MCIFKKPKAPATPAAAPPPPNPSVEGIDIPEEVKGSKKNKGRSSLRIPRTSSASLPGGGTGLNIPV